MNIDMMIRELDELVRARALTKMQRLRQEIDEELATLAQSTSNADESHSPIPQSVVRPSGPSLTDMEDGPV